MIKSILLPSGKEYRLFTSRNELQVKTSRVHAETGMPIWMRVNSARLLAQVIRIIHDGDHAMALEMDADIEWAKITPEQRMFHAHRVEYAMSLKAHYGVDNAIEACHIDALIANDEITAIDLSTQNPAFRAFWVESDYMLIGAMRAWLEMLEEAHDMNEEIRATSGHIRWLEFFSNDPKERRAIIDACHAQALADNQARDERLEARRVAEVVRAEFYLHNPVFQRDFIAAAHDEALLTNAKLN